jgi:diguanylate cyclase (GGDEF)-like protein/PAS domain S-box-containing protein
MYQQEAGSHLKEHRAELEGSYRDTIRSFGRVVEIGHTQGVDTPAVRAILARLVAAESLPAEQAAQQHRRLRGELYRELYDDYLLLRRSDVRTLQIILPDGRSFLRLHRPDLVGDRIAEDRPLVEAVIRSSRMREGFENGRVLPGYRYVFPLFSEGRLAAVVDYGLSDDALRGVLGQADPAQTRATRLVLRRDFVESVAHPSVLGLFEPAAMAPGFVVEREGHPLRPKPLQSTTLPLASIDGVLAADETMQRAILEGRPKARFVCLGWIDCHAVVVMPVLDSAGRLAAFFASYRADQDIGGLRWRLALAFALGTLLLLLFVLSVRRGMSSRRRLRTITQHMAEGLYVMDRQGRIIHVNEAACSTLGYSEQELIGQQAHRLFHRYSAGETLAADACPVYKKPISGEVYRGEQEGFATRNGDIVPVSLVASPLREEDSITGAVVLFRDVSKEHEARERLRKADIAFRNLGEAVVLTDAEGSIQAVNQAFTTITGYAEAEVLGRNPRILQSGRHDRRFYERLWETLLSEGRWEGEIWNRRKNGEVFPEWLRITAVYGAADLVLGYVSVFSDVSESRANQERLEHLAYYDGVTGLYNRNAIMDMTATALREAAASGRRLALMYLDVDRFKRINDMVGHQTGDALLRVIGARIQAVLRSDEHVARLGGDEFVMLVHDNEEQSRPTRIAHILLAAIRRPLSLEGRLFHLSASIGIAVYPDDGDEPGSLLKHADAAMHLAKSQGRDVYRYFTSAIAQETTRRFEMEVDLRAALRRDELRLVYQPKVSLTNGAVVGLEALLRWCPPGGQMRAPGYFLDVARDAGLMQPITEWVVHEAVRQCKVWRSSGLACGRMSVNLDVGSCEPRALEGLLLETVHEAGIEPKDLELEIVETAMQSDAETLAFWRRLVDAGFEVSIDDFGTGESSLGRMKHLPISTLKIDRSFVSDLEADADDRAMIRTIIAMTKTLGKSVIAEGVETEAQLRFLMRSGCDAVQGYYLSRPVFPEQLEELLRGHPFESMVARLREPEQEPETPGVVRQLAG